LLTNLLHLLSVIYDAVTLGKNIVTNENLLLSFLYFMISVLSGLVVLTF